MVFIIHLYKTALLKNSFVISQRNHMLNEMAPFGTKNDKTDGYENLHNV